MLIRSNRIIFTTTRSLSSLFIPSGQHTHTYTRMFFVLTSVVFRHAVGGLQDLAYSNVIKPFQSTQLDLDPSMMTGTAQYSLQVELVRPSAEVRRDTEK